VPRQRNAAPILALFRKGRSASRFGVSAAGFAGFLVCRPPASTEVSACAGVFPDHDDAWLTGVSACWLLFPRGRKVPAR